MENNTYYYSKLLTFRVYDCVGIIIHIFELSVFAVSDTEFRLVISSGSDTSSCHSSPAMTGCSPLFADLSGTLSRLPKNKGRVIVLRAPKAELKAVWQNLIQRQM